MYMVIAVVFVLLITSILVFAAHYECEHFEENHRKKKKVAVSQRNKN